MIMSGKCTVSKGWYPGGTQQSSIRGGTAPKFNPLPFYIPFLAEKEPLMYTSQLKMVPLFTYLVGNFTSLLIALNALSIKYK